MLAFHNDPKVKKMYLDRVLKHYKADEIIKGVYWQNGRGCAVGCTMETPSNAHQEMEGKLGIPRVISWLEDRLFERLENGDSKEFPLRFLKAIPIGADLSLIWPKFAVWLLTDKKDGVIQYAKPDGKKAIQAIADTYKRVIKGEKIDVNEWLEKRKSAYAAYAAAADAYAAAAAYAAYAAAADAYAAAAAYAADAYAAYAAAADAYAADAARQKHYKKMADKLIALLEKAPVKKIKNLK